MQIYPYKLWNNKGWSWTSEERTATTREHRSHWRMASSGMLRCVALVRTDVSEELSASFIRVTRIGELGTMLAVTSNRRTLRRNVVPSSPILVTLMQEARSSSETSVLTRATWHNIPESAILHSHCGENLKCYAEVTIQLLGKDTLCGHQHSDSKISRDMYSVRHYAGEGTYGKSVSGTVFRPSGKLFLIINQPFRDLWNTCQSIRLYQNLNLNY
jgi:hypothetical protein